MHARVRGNECANRLASTADITSGLQLGRVEVLRGLRNFLNMDRPKRHSCDRVKEKRVEEKGSGRRSTVRGRERAAFNQTNIGAVSRAALGTLLRERERGRGGGERLEGSGWGGGSGERMAPRCYLEQKLNLKPILIYLQTKDRRTGVGFCGGVFWEGGGGCLFCFWLFFFFVCFVF